MAVTTYNLNVSEANKAATDAHVFGGGLVEVHWNIDGTTCATLGVTLFPNEFSGESLGKYRGDPVEFP